MKRDIFPSLSFFKLCRLIKKLVLIPFSLNFEKLCCRADFKTEQDGKNVPHFLIFFSFERIKDVWWAVENAEYCAKSDVFIRPFTQLPNKL